MDTIDKIMEIAEQDDLQALAALQEALSLMDERDRLRVLKYLNEEEKSDH